MMTLQSALTEPLKFRPLLKGKPWGGDGLYRLLGKGRPGDSRVGESWELSDNPAGETAVAEGRFAGQGFAGLFAAHRPDILGPGHAPSHRFPLLYKFIYASDNLSVQVHPGEGSGLGDAKTECWYIVDAPENARLIVGLKDAGDREKVLEALRSGACLRHLNSVPVSPGDTVFIPAGTVHAITPGILIYEVQQNSDTTFRLYDWDRVDDQGLPRPLHRAQAAQVMDFTCHDRHVITPLSVDKPTHREDFLAACPFFALIRHADLRDRAPLPAGCGFRVLTCVKGGFRILHAAGSRPLGLGETALVPAGCAQASLEDPSPERNSQCIISFVPDLERDVVAPLLKAGHAREEVEALGGFYGIRLRGRGG